MKLRAVVALHVAGEQVLRSPKLWDKMKKAFGGEPDLRTDQKRASLEAAAVVDATRQALSSLGATNAVSLVIDDQVLFQDREGKEDDLGDLFLAFHDNASVFGKEFRLLRLAVEHEEAGLHVVLEVVARSVHPQDEAAARVVISGRIRDFEPRPGEDAEAYRARVEPLTQKSVVYEAHRQQFEAFVSRVANAMRAAMPEARVEIQPAEAMVKRPPRGEVARRQAPLPPTDRRYDPHELYYPHPFDTMLSMMMWSSIFSMAMPPHVVVVNDHGDSLGHADEIADQGGPDALDDAATDTADADMGGDDMGGGDTGGDDFGGGDFGGDFGGGDFGDW